jgi:hypothetical protein
MIFIAVVGGLLLLMAILGVVSRYRARRSGSRVSDWNEEAIQNRLDSNVNRNPFLLGGTRDWMTYRQRDQKPGK